MPWQPVSTNRHERTFDSLEKFYRGIAEASAPLQNQHYLIPYSLQLQHLTPVREVRQEWIDVRDLEAEDQDRGGLNWAVSRFRDDSKLPDPWIYWPPLTILILLQSVPDKEDVMIVPDKSALFIHMWHLTFMALALQEKRS